MNLSMSELAKRLDLNLETLERWIRQGRIPVDKEGNHGVFDEAELKKWAGKKRLVYRSAPSGKTKGKDRGEGLLLSAVRQGGCFRGVQGNEKEAVLRSAVELVPGLSEDEADALCRQILAREELTSTGIGKGVAVPHPRNPMGDVLDSPLIVTCFLENDIAFDSIDDMPVSVLFLLLSPSMEKHLGMLSKLSFCLRDNGFVDFLKTAPEPDLFFEKIASMEQSIEKSGM